MTDDTAHAFAHPIERAKATSNAGPLDRISLRDYVTSVEIGAFQLERGTVQRLSFNVVVEVRHADADLGDDVDLILSYDRVTEAIDIELAAERLDLLETLAERIADRILTEPQAERVFVRIEKLDRGAGKLGVEIVRDGSSAIPSEAEGAPTPRVAFFSSAALASDHVTSWIDQLQAMGAPLILCVPPLAAREVDTSDPNIAARITLLSIEQMAWTTAAKDERLAVVATKTELDWAMKNGQTTIWAPSKIVLGSADFADGLVDDGVGLAAWFCTQIGACELVIIGDNAPTSAQIPVRTYSVAQRDL